MKNMKYTMDYITVPDKSITLQIVGVLLLTYDMQTPGSHVKLNELSSYPYSKTQGITASEGGASKVVLMKSNLRNTMVPFTRSTGHTFML